MNFRGGRYHTAFAAGQDDIVRTLLAHEINVNIYGGKYGSALQAACASGSEEAVRMLVRRGADIYATGGTHDSCFKAAAVNGWPRIVRYLMKETDTTEPTLNQTLDYKKSAAIERARQTLQTAIEMKEEFDDTSDDDSSIKTFTDKRLCSRSSSPRVRAIYQSVFHRSQRRARKPDERLVLF